VVLEPASAPAAAARPLSLRLRTLILLVKEQLETMKGSLLYSTNPNLHLLLKAWEQEFLSSLDHLDSDEGQQDACYSLAMLLVNILDPACPLKETRVSKTEYDQNKILLTEWTGFRKRLMELLKINLPINQTLEGFLKQYKTSDFAAIILKKKQAIVDSVFRELMEHLFNTANHSVSERRAVLERFKNSIKAINERAQPTGEKLESDLLKLSQRMGQAYEESDKRKEEFLSLLNRIVQEEKSYFETLKIDKKFFEKLSEF
jgi:hypothetical protein